MENTKLRASQKYKKRSTFDSIWRQLRKNKGAIVGMILLVVIIIIALVSPYIFNYETDVIANNVKERMQHPSSEHWFGTFFPQARAWRPPDTTTPQGHRCP